jgi:hypothetical protein
VTGVEVLVQVVVRPPGIVLVSILRIVEVTGEGDEPVDVGDTPPIVVVVTRVKAVDWALGGILVVVVITLEVVCRKGLEGALVGNVEDAADVNDGVDTMMLLEKPGMLVGWPTLVLRDVLPEVDANCDEVGSPFAGLDETPESEVSGTEEMIGVVSGVLVDSVLKRLGGVMLSIHSVVPLMTEK